jgi:Rrf2 family iron-sulfur cluster assembly transcriptional regulator
LEHVLKGGKKMSLTIKSCYALRGLYELYKLQNIQSQNEEKNYVSIFNISENTEIPNEFLAKIFSELKRAGIVDSGRGKFGGFNLTKNPEDVKLSEIVEALEVPLNSYDCVTKGTCTNQDACPADFVWKRVQKAIFDELSKITLKDIIEYGEQKGNVSPI